MANFHAPRGELGGKEEEPRVIIVDLAAFFSKKEKREKKKGESPWPPMGQGAKPGDLKLCVSKKGKRKT